MTDKGILYRTHIDVADIYHKRYRHSDMRVALSDKESSAHFVLRMLAFCLIQDEKCELNVAHDQLQPDLYIKNEFDDVILWCDVGWPSLKKITRALHRADKVKVVTIKEHNWFDELPQKIRQNKKFYVVALNNEFIEKLISLLAIKLSWNVVIEHNRISVTVAEHFIQSDLVFLTK